MKTRSLPFGIATLLGGVFVAVACSASPGVEENVTVTPGKLAPAEARELSASAARVLVHIAEARGDVHEADFDRARQELNEAQALVGVIRDDLPTTRVRDRVWVARKHLEYEDTEQVIPDLVPIHRELDFVAEFVPTKKAREHLEEARKALEEGDRARADAALRAVDASVVYTEVDMPLSEIDAHVTAALNLLAKGEPDAADAALEAAEESVTVFVAATDDLVGHGTPQTTGAP